MLLEQLPREDLGEYVRRVVVSGHVSHADAPSAAQLAHLEQLPVDVPRVLSRGEAMAEIIRPLVVHRTIQLVPLDTRRSRRYLLPLGAALGLAGVAAAGIVYGRVRLHSSPHSAVNATGEERRNALMGKGWARRTVHVHGVTPSGDAVLEAVDDVGRELFAAGEQGALKRSSTPLHYPLG